MKLCSIVEIEVNSTNKKLTDESVKEEKVQLVTTATMKIVLRKNMTIAKLAQQ